MSEKREQPLVSIGIPCYNSAKKIQRAILSCLKQSYKNLEILVSDNCSTDHTWEEIIELQEKYSQLKCIRQKENIGMIANYKFVIENSSGAYFMWLAADDWLSEGFVEKCMEKFSEVPQLFACSGNLIEMSDEKTMIPNESASSSYLQSSSYERVYQYYKNVDKNSEYYSIFKRNLFDLNTLQREIGNDWHVVASFLMQGKMFIVENEYIYKMRGGVSTTTTSLIKSMGLNSFTYVAPIFFIAGGGLRSIWQSTKISALEKPIYSAYALLGLFKRKNWIRAGIKISKRFFQFLFKRGSIR